MKCPSCNSKIGMIKCSKFMIGLALKKAYLKNEKNLVPISRSRVFLCHEIPLFTLIFIAEVGNYIFLNKKWVNDSS